MHPKGRMKCMQDTINKSVDRDRLSVLLAVLLLGNVLFQFVDLPQQVWHLQPLGSPLEIHLTETTLLIAFMVGLVCTGISLILQDHPHLMADPERPIYISWILPAFLTGVSVYLLSLSPTLPIWMVGLFLTSLVLGLTISAEYIAVSPNNPGYPTVRLALNVLAYLLAFVLFTLIYQTRMRSLITGTLTTTTAALLGLNLLSVGEVPLRQAALFASIAGLIIGESTWALNYLQIRAWAGGVLLLLIFYLTINVAHQYLLESLNSSILGELSIVTILVLAIILVQYL